MSSPAYDPERQFLFPAGFHLEGQRMRFQAMVMVRRVRHAVPGLHADVGDGQAHRRPQDQVRVIVEIQGDGSPADLRHQPHAMGGQVRHGKRSAVEHAVFHRKRRQVVPELFRLPGGQRVFQDDPGGRHALREHDLTVFGRFLFRKGTGKPVNLFNSGSSQNTISRNICNVQRLKYADENGV